MLKARLEALKNERTEVVNQDIDSLVKAKLEELEPQIRAEAERVKANAIRVYDIRIAAFEEAVSIVETAATSEETVETEETES